MPRLKPLEEWICDTCRQPVSIADGWVEWRKSDMYLNVFLGPDGLQQLLGTLDRGRILDPSAERLPAIPDLPSFVEVFRRLHIPYYEEARLYFEDAL